MSQLAALIFDVDGTIAETERDGHRVAFNRAFAEAGLDWQWSVERYGQLLQIPGGKERLRYYWQQYQPQFEPEQPSADWLRQMHRAKNQHYQDCIAQGAIPLRPGVKRLIQEAREAELKLAIATTSALANAMALLEYHLDPSWFTVIAAGDIVTHKKPAPDIYHYVLRQLQLPPEQCLVLEDSEPGLSAATQAGLCTVVTVNDYTQHQDFTAAQLVVSDLGEPTQPLSVVQEPPLHTPCFTLGIAQVLLNNAVRRQSDV
ncbi:MAG: HAD family hydrolase [Cyanobacteria bacterium P01_G01_bin.54]